MTDTVVSRAEEAADGSSDGRGWRRRLPLALAAAGVVAGVTAVLVLRDVGPVTTGRAARIGCGLVALQDRPVTDVDDELPADLLTPLLRTSADGDLVEATLLGRYASRAAPDGDGGCRLLRDDEPVPTPDVEPMAPAADDLVVPTSPRTEAANAGLDALALDGAVTGAFARLPDDSGARVGTRAVVVVHQGTVVAERYADGFDADTPLIGWEMTTSVAAVAAGRIAATGALDPSAPVAGTWSDDDPRAAITWDQLLRMTSGLQWEEGDGIGSDVTTSLFTPIDAGAYAADQPLVEPPGTSWSYSSGSADILCDALVDVAGGDPLLLLRELVFEPLAMTSATVGSDGTAPLCSSFAYATARDWARLGLLVEQGGAWGGEQLVTPGWLAATTTPVTVDASDDGVPAPYGRAWWLNRGPDGVRLPTVPADAFWASGDEGQHVVVVPSADLVVVRLGLDRGLDDPDRGLERLVASVVDAVPGARDASPADGHAGDVGTAADGQDTTVVVDATEDDVDGDTTED